MRAEDVVTSFMAAWQDHDLDAALALISADCVFEATGPAPDGTTCVGLDAIRAAWAPIFADSASRFRIEETLSAGDRVVQRWSYSWSDGHIRGVDVMRVSDGKIVEKLSYVKG
jgi:ketosteroid isomerase-like protein